MISNICAAGGIAMKSPFLMQIYADVLNKPIVVGDSAQSGARGSAIYAAVAAGKFATIQEAARHYARPNKGSYTPIPENVALYEKLYQEYKLLHDYFGRGGNAVMDRLYDIYHLATK
jgi:L-ribulokinase